MQVWAVNSNNDIYTTNGRLNISVGLQAVLQNCEHAAKALMREMIYAYDRGINVFDSIWDGSPNVLSFEASVRAALNRVENVIAVEGFETELVNNTISYSATIRTTFGTGIVSGQL